MPRIVDDPDPDSPYRSAWRTYRRCLESIESDFTVILQDDTIACRGFRQAARAAMDARPGRLIAFYHSIYPPAMMPHFWSALDRCDPFFEFPLWRWTPTVALGWPRELAVDFLGWIDTAKKKLPKHWLTDDPLVGEWTTARKQPCVATVPSLVQHPDDCVTIVGSHNGKGDRRDTRMAACWIGDTPVKQWISLL